MIIIAVVIAGFFIVSAVLERNKSSENPADGTAEEAKTETVFDIGSVGELSRYECNIVDDIKLERDSADKWIWYDIRRPDAERIRYSFRPEFRKAMRGFCRIRRRYYG